MLFVYYAINIATDDFLAPCLEDFIDKLSIDRCIQVSAKLWQESRF